MNPHTLATAIVRSCAGLSAAVGLACAAVQPADAPDVEYDEGYPFGSLETFAWKPIDMHAAEVRGENVNAELEVKRVVRSDLLQKGFREVGREKADFQVTFHAFVGDRTETTVGARFPNTSVYGAPAAVDMTNIQYVDGTIIIEVIDRSGRVVWRGSKTGAVPEERLQEDRSRAIDELVRSILSGFPP